MLPLWAIVNPLCIAMPGSSHDKSLRQLSSFADSPTFIFGRKSDFIADSQGDSAEFDPFLRRIR